MSGALVPNHIELVTASEPVTRPDISSGSITTLEMSDDAMTAAAERERIPVHSGDLGAHSFEEWRWEEIKAQFRGAPTPRREPRPSAPPKERR